MQEGSHKIWVNVEGERFLVEVLDLNQRPIIAIVEGSRFEIYPENTPGATDSKIQSPEDILQPREQIRSIPAETICEVIAPMPGDISKILVKAGQSVQPGDPLCVLDAMKMKNTIHAPQSGIVQEILTEEGQAVEHGVVLFRFS
jgi:biotin carboxyl carrier protein